MKYILKKQLTKEDLIHTKWIMDDEQQSKAFQRELFKLGFGWGCLRKEKITQHLDKHHLMIDNDSIGFIDNGFMGRSDWDAHEYKNSGFEDFFKKKYTEKELTFGEFQATDKGILFNNEWIALTDEEIFNMQKAVAYAKELRK